MIFDWYFGILTFLIMTAAITCIFCIALDKKYIKKNFKTLGVIVIISALFIGIVLGAISTETKNTQPNNRCPDHLDECVLVNEICPAGLFAQSGYCWQERTETGAAVYSGYKNQPKSIKNYRFKTDCEKNPREDNDCVCENYRLLNYVNEFLNCNIYNQSNEIEDFERFTFCFHKYEECISAHDRTPEERCAYFNKTPVYDLNNTMVIGCQ